MTLGEKLRRAREQQELSQKEVAEAIGVSQPMYCYFENGEKIPTWALMVTLSDVLKVSLDYLKSKSE